MTVRSSVQSVSDHATPADRPESRCPLCGGPMVEVRDLVRCGRCHFTTCVGCGEGFAEPCDASD